MIKNIHHITLYFSVLLLSLFFSATYASAQEPHPGYTTSTLDKPAFTNPEVIVHATMLNNWLNENYETLSNDYIDSVREQLYALIDSQIKHLYSEKREVITNNDPILRMLFLWADRLGAYGGTSIYNSIISDQTEEQISIIELPEFITLQLEKDLLMIQADNESWSFQIPYYFMVFGMDDFIAENELRTQMVVFSTGTAKDNSELGFSQSTLVFLHSPEPDYENFKNYWENAFGLTEDSEIKELGQTGKESSYSHDKASDMHVEITTWSKYESSFAVVYMGREGTYQWNRPHYIDFINSIVITN